MNQQFSEKQLTKIEEILKFMVLAASGVLVFSAGLISERDSLPPLSIHLLLISWLALGISAALGILAMMRIPVMMEERKSDHMDNWLVWPARIHQILFAAGVILLSAALANYMLAEVPPETKAPKTISEKEQVELENALPKEPDSYSTH